jgi:hypothetical protein
LLSRLAVDDEGRAHIEDDVYNDYKSERGSFDKERMIARAKWLACEIPLLAESYGELYEHESVEALSLCSDIAGFDFTSDEAGDYITQILPQLEKWFLFSNPGGRLMRGDKDAQEAFMESLSSARERVKELEDAQKKAVTADKPTEEQRVLIEYEINKIESRVRKMEKALASLNDQRESLIEKLYE